MRDFSNLDDRRLFEGVKDTFRSYIRRYARSSSCFPFYNEILNRLRQSLLKDTYIDALDRDIKLEIDCAKGTVSVDITTRISYMSIQNAFRIFRLDQDSRRWPRPSPIDALSFCSTMLILRVKLISNFGNVPIPRGSFHILSTLTSLSRGTLGTHVLSSKRFIRFRLLHSSMPISLYFLVGACVLMRLLLDLARTCTIHLLQPLARITFICTKAMLLNLGMT